MLLCKWMTLSLLMCILSFNVFTQTDTIYMSVLSSQRHQWGNIDNPVIGIFVSTDSGESWEHIGWRGYIRTFYTEAGPDGTIWAACGNGVLRSRDMGETFVITTGWEITEVLKVRIDPSNPDIVYAATAYGIFKTIDGGTHWYEKNNGLPVLPFTSDLIIDRNDPSRILTATEDGIYISTNAGDNWKQLGLGGLGIRVIVQHPGDSSIFYSGTEDDGVFKSTDRGSTWQQVNNGLEHLTVYAIAIDPTNPDLIYAGTHGGGVYRTHDAGKNWQQIIRGLKNPDVHSLIVLPHNSDIIFAGTLNGGLFRSNNRGESWEFNSQDGGQIWGLSVNKGNR